MKSKYYYQVIKDKEIELETTNLEEAIIYSEDIDGEIKKVVEHLGQTMVTGTFGEMTQEQYDEFRVERIINDLELTKAVYEFRARYGHFGYYTKE